MRSIGPLLTVALVASLAHAEGVGNQDKAPSTSARLYGATTAVPMAGGLVSIGGSALRHLPKGSQRWELLHRQPGDNLYRVATDDSGRVLAAWEKDPFVHSFTTASKQHLQFPKPLPLPKDQATFQVDDLAFSPNGRDAVVFMKGELRFPAEGQTSAAYRISLDGKSAPELLFKVDTGLLLHSSPHGAVYAIPKNPQQKCQFRSCLPIAAIVAYEFTQNGVTQKTLLRGDQVPMNAAWIMVGSTDERVVLRLDLGGRGNRALLRWRYGDAEPGYRTLPPRLHWWDVPMRMSRVTPTGEFIELQTEEREEDGHLEITRYPPEGGEPQVTRLKALQDIDLKVHGMGVRSDGTLWVHWGDHIALLSPGKPPRSYNLEPLLPRRAEWAGADIYLDSPECLWVGIDHGKGRDFVRLHFADLEKRAKPWP